MSQLLLRLWLEATEQQGYDLLAADPKLLELMGSALPEGYQHHRLRYCSITDPKVCLKTVRCLSLTLHWVLGLPGHVVGMKLFL